MRGLKVIADQRDRDRWLEARKSYVTASSAWMMVCDSRDGKDLWGQCRMSLAGLGDDFDETEPMFWGITLEPAVMGAFAKTELREYCITPFGLLVEDPGCSDIAATPDCLVWNHPKYPGVPIPADLKIGGYDWTVTKEMKEEAKAAGIEEETLSPVREYAQVQLQVQMACVDAPAGMVIRLAPAKSPAGFGLMLKHWTFTRHDGLVDTLRHNAQTMMREVRALREGRLVA